MKTLTTKGGAAYAAPRTLLTWLLVLIILLGVVTPALAADIQQIDLPAIFASGEKGTCTLNRPRNSRHAQKETHVG